MITVQNVCKHYGTGKNRHPALRGIDLSFRDTEFVAILGASGSGKTTLLNVIGGLDHYDSGDLLIDRVSTEEYTSRDWDTYRNHSVGFIFQSYNLIQHQTILSNVEMALTIAGISGPEKRERAKKALEAVGLGEHLHKRPNQLSGGQMQRVAIARALVNDPTVILADEPTGALDSKTSVQVMELLKDIAKDRLIIMVTHNPELAQQYASRIITLKDGLITDDSDPYRPDLETLPKKPQPKKHSSMGLWTSLSLSFHNLWTKRKRTLLTSFAGSIGIIGIALIAALSSGVDAYIEDQEANMAYQYPLLVETLNMDVSSVLNDLGGELMEENGDQVGIVGVLEKVFSMLDTNDLGALKSYIDSPESTLASHGTVEYTYNVEPQLYKEYNGQLRQVNPDQTLGSLGLPLSNVFFPMPQNEELYLDRYDVKAGHWPENPNECILVLTAQGKISDYLLYVLGMKDPSQVDGYISDFIHGEPVEPESAAGLHYEYEDFLGIDFQLVNASDYYTYDEEYKIWRERIGDTGFLRNLVRNGEPVKIVGVVQPKAEYGAGVLDAGLNYPFSLVEKTVAQAKESPVVQAQLDHPELDIFSGRRFDDLETTEELNPLSLVEVDTDQLMEAIVLDRDRLQNIFLTAADFDSMPMTYPEIDLSGLSDFGKLEETIRSRLEQDLPGLLETVQFSPEMLSSVSKAVVEDYIAYLDEQNYLDFGKITESLHRYFTSDGYRKLVQDWLDTLDLEHGTPEKLQAKIQELSDLLVADLNRFLETQQLPQIPVAENTFSEYLETGRWKPLVDKAIGNAIEESKIVETWNAYLDETIHPILAAELGKAVGVIQGEMEKMGDSIIAQTQAGVQVSLGRGFSAVLDQIFDCVTVDENAFQKAFSLRLDTRELSDLLSSFSDISKASPNKNLSKLGYVEMSRPMRIEIYPKDFESKDAVISELEVYNQQMEAQDGPAISYTDALGNMLNTVMGIVNIVTSALVAAVAVSLVVSSIMIGVITYISVLERRKEIGILRAMGASRHNVSQIFNAETLITGLLSGSMGIGLAYLLLIPLNLLMHSRTQVFALNAYLPVGYALILIAISVVLTTLGGIMPAYHASKSDPVEALRTE